MTAARRQPPQLPPTPVWFKVWFAVCAALGLGMLGVAVWAVITLVNHFTSGGAA